MNEQMQILYRDTTTKYLMGTMQALQIEVIRLKSSTDIEDIVDSAYAVKLMETMLDTLKKKCRSVRGNLEYKLGQLFVTMDQKNIRTEHCTATPTVSQTATPPTFSKDYDAYAEVMRHFGVPEAHIKAGLLQIHYKHFGTYLDNMAKQGKGLPDCIEAMKKHDTYKVTYRKAVNR